MADAEARGNASFVTRVILIGVSSAIRGDGVARSFACAPNIEIVGVIATDGASGELLPGIPTLGAYLTRAAVAGALKPPTAAILCGLPPVRATTRDLLERMNILRLRPLVAEEDGGALNLRALKLEDLLGRAASSADLARVRESIAGKRVLVTGGGGSIGSELVRQIARLKPARITVLENSEFNLYSVDQELAGVPGTPRVTALCDIRSPEAVQRWFSREKPDIVFHAAALKHVPIVEAHACEGVLTNVLGTRNVAAACAHVGAHMVLVSTDKAVCPSSVMGATKRIAELYCQALDRHGDIGGPRFLTARLGNVLGSAGSVSPLFERQLAEGGPLTVTHADVVRFFITIPQAAGFLLETCAMGLTQDVRGVAHVLDMGEAVRVVDLARDMILLRGLRPDVDVPIKFVGLRPGEKMSEQLIGEDERVERAEGARIMAVHGPERDLPALEAEIDTLIRLARSGQDELAKATMWSILDGAQRHAAVG